MMIKYAVDAGLTNLYIQDCHTECLLRGSLERLNDIGGMKIMKGSLRYNEWWIKIFVLIAVMLNLANFTTFGAQYSNILRLLLMMSFIICVSAYLGLVYISTFSFAGTFLGLVVMIMDIILSWEDVSGTAFLGRSIILFWMTGILLQIGEYVYKRALR